MYCYDVYNLNYWLIDNWGQGRECNILFYVVNCNDFDVILRMFDLRQLNILLNFETKQWRFKINIEKLQIDITFEFIQGIESKLNIFVIVCVATAQEGDSRNDHISKLFIELREFNDIFSNNQINILFAFK